MNLQTFVNHYLYAALWSDLPEGCNLTTEDIHSDSLERATKDCERFIAENNTDLCSVANEEQNGHDFWLTRNRHGAGFWDRGYDQEVSDRLTSSAHTFGECYLYVGDDGKLYLA